MIGADVDVGVDLSWQKTGIDRFLVSALGPETYPTRGGGGCCW
jgi:hypothetical protein